MTALGQTEKNSLRANVFRVTSESGHCPRQSACLKGANRRHPRLGLGGGQLRRPSRSSRSNREASRIDVITARFNYRLGGPVIARYGSRLSCISPVTRPAEMPAFLLS